MGDKSGIEWTEATWNPTTGCTKVSEGCRWCYAKFKEWPRLSANPKTVYYQRKFEDVALHEERLDQPVRWTRPRRIFVNSMSDVFHEAIPTSFIRRIWHSMEAAPQHIFQILTKRPDRMVDLCRELPLLPNVWLGTSVENQDTANERIPALIETRAAVRWLSCEPLLGTVRLPTIPWLRDDLHWVVCGGESGKNARPLEMPWAQSLRNQCLNAGVPFFMKQGSQANWATYKEFESFPVSLQVREYPIALGGGGS